jgi:hypothetical protein
VAFDAHANFAYSTVLTAPSPATSGTSVVLQSGDGAKFPAAPFNAAVWPAGAQPLTSNAEIVRVTAKSTDTLTITRTQEGTSARTVVVGDQIAAVISAKSLTDIEAAIPAVPTNYLAPNGAIRETYPRQLGTSLVSLTSGKLQSVAIALVAGDVIGHITFVSNSTAAGTPTHWWFFLADSAGNIVATTADQTTTAWGTNTAQTLAISNIVSGAASSYTVPTTGLYRVGLCVVATTTPTIDGVNSANTTLVGLSPALCQQSTAATFTTPPSLPSAPTMTSSSVNGMFYVYVSA